jgi:DNA-binding transcriptional MocR family regulator
LLPEQELIMPKQLAAAIEDRSARGIAAAVSRLITAGQLTIGTRLPTVRALAAELGVSPTTVSEAWQVLGDAGVIAAQGRNGTTVLGPSSPLAPRRYRDITEGPGHYTLDLSTGTPDPALLPDLSAMLARVSRGALTTSYLDDPLYPPLAEALRARWPFHPEAMTVVDGAMDALDRVTGTLLRLGDRVMVEHTAFPPLLDLLEVVGVEIIGLDTDDDGITVASLRAALADRPVALFTQPRAHNPLGISTSEARVAALAEVLRPTEVMVIEDDHAGDISIAPLASFGSHLPERTILVQSFSKSHGPDLRLAAVGGAGDVINQMARRRMLGPGWSSRLLQAVLAELLTDEGTRIALACARDTYAERRARLSSALDERGIATMGRDGINLWVEVADERAAQVALAARGIGVAPGAPFIVNPGGSEHLRLTVGLVNTDFDALADHIAGAAHSPRTALRPTR